MRAIDTEYKGYLFRSRLEARWAIFFDELGIEWLYESEGFDLGNGIWYLPDFLLKNFILGDMYVEVKPEVPYPDSSDIEKIVGFNNQNEICAIVVGDPIKSGGIFTLAKKGINNIEINLAFLGLSLDGKDFFLFPFCEDGILASISNNGIVVYDEPADFANFGKFIEHPKLIHAKKKARQARFEHGT